jgi:hypothetical protein
MAEMVAPNLVAAVSEARQWDRLMEMAKLPDNTMSLTALWALVRVDPQAASEYMVPLFIEREDWALSLAAGHVA